MPLAELSSSRAGCRLQFQQWLQGQGVSIRSPSPKGWMMGVDLATCWQGLTVTVAGPEKEGRGSHCEEGEGWDSG